MFKKGDLVKISDNGLLLHSKSIPAHMGHSQATIDWRNSLSKIQNGNVVGIVERTFPNSSHINVIFDDICYGVDEYMLIKKE